VARPKKTGGEIAQAKAFGEWITAARERLRLSKKALSIAAKCSEMTIGRVEKGEGASPATLQRLAAALHLDEAEARARIGIPSIPADTETSISQQKLLGFCRVLSARRQEELVGIAKMMTLSEEGRSWIVTETDNFKEAVTNIVKATEPHQ